MIPLIISTVVSSVLCFAVVARLATPLCSPTLLNEQSGPWVVVQRSQVRGSWYSAVRSVGRGSAQSGPWVVVQRSEVRGSWYSAVRSVGRDTA